MAATHEAVSKCSHGVIVVDPNVARSRLRVALPLVPNGLLTVAFTTSWTVACIASDEPKPELHYEAPLGCPSGEDFAQQLAGRTRNTLAMSRIRIRVIIVHGSGDYVAKLELVDPQGDRQEREFSGPSCSEVTQAVALVAAVTVDSAAAHGSAENATANPLPAASAPPAQKLKAPAPTPAAAQPDVVAPPKPKNQTDAPIQRHDDYSLGIALGLHSGIAPAVSPTFGIGFGYHPRDAWGVPEYRLEILGSKSKSNVVRFDSLTEGQIDLLWVASRAIACPVGLSGPSMRFGPCVALELGMLRGTGQSALGNASNSGWWLAPAILLNWALELGRVRFSLVGGAEFPLVRDHFRFQPNFEAFYPPLPGYVAEVAVGRTFE